MEELLAKMHEVLAKDLLARIESGEATTADLNIARQFLRDNGIDCHMKKGGTLHKLSESLPFVDPDRKVVGE